MENIFFDKRDLKYCGSNVIIGKTVRIRRPEETVIGDNVIIDDFTYISTPLEIGSYTHIGAGCSLIGGSSRITIGSFVNIAPSCQLVAASNDYRGGGLVGPAIPEEYAGTPESAPVVIGSFALLACSTVVLPGAVMPEGMATGAFSLVKDAAYREWSLYVGIPCRYHCGRDASEMKTAAAKLRGKFWVGGGQKQTSKDAAGFQDGDCAADGLGRTE